MYYSLAVITKGGVRTLNSETLTPNTPQNRKPLFICISFVVSFFFPFFHDFSFFFFCIFSFCLCIFIFAFFFIFFTFYCYFSLCAYHFHFVFHFASSFFLFIFLHFFSFLSHLCFLFFVFGPCFPMAGSNRFSTTEKGSKQLLGFFFWFRSSVSSFFSSCFSCLHKLIIFSFFFVVF